MRRRFRLRRPIARTAMRAQSAALGEQAQNKRRTSAEQARHLPHAATPALGKAGYPRAS
jgi:hypothetical protein